MISVRLKRRLVEHHFVLAVIVAASLALGVEFLPSPNPLFRWSMATAYVGLALLGASLIIGPLNLLNRRRNPVSTDLRRDVGIWAGVVSCVHFVVGWQIHMKHRYLYFLSENEATRQLRPRTDFFGFANDTGLAAVLIALLLLVLSNDYYLRKLGSARWKWFQQWNYALFVLVLAHGIAYQIIEKRAAGFVVALTILSVSAIVAQTVGYLKVRARP